MKTIVPHSTLWQGSWAEDLTPSQEIRQKFMYVQCMGHYCAGPHYGVIDRSGLRSYLLLYTNRGEGVVEYRGQRVSVPAHCSVLLDCDAPHSYYTSEDHEWDLYWIHFHGTCIDGYLGSILENWNVNTTDLPADFFHRIYGYCHREPTLTSYIQCSTELIGLCSQFLLSLRREKEASPVVRTPLVRGAMAYMEEHVTEAISLDALCRHLNVSKFYLAHSFKEQTGFGPAEYLITLRLTKAKSLLRSTTLPVAQIAERCGFNGSSYFIQAFRKREGMTPLAYRKYFLHPEPAKEMLTKSAFP